MKRGGPPLDAASVMAALAALAVEALARRRKRRMSRADVARWKKTWHGNRRRRAKEATAARIAAQKRARRPTRRPFGESISDRMLAAMAPGEWYGAHDLARAAGGPRDWHGKVLQILWPRGYVERAPNPAWRGAVAPQRIWAGTIAEPRWVYRLTEKGELRRAAVRMVQ